MKDRSLNITGTPGYDWDPGYDGIQGFPTQLRNRVSEPPTPQRRFSPKQTEEGVSSSPKGGTKALPKTGGPKEKLNGDLVPGILRRDEDIPPSQTGSPGGRRYLPCHQ